MRVASSMLVLAAVMALPMGARAAEADTMSVTGQITDQSGCTISLSNGGAIDYGLIVASSLNQSTTTNLPSRSLAAAVTCATPTYMAIQIHDLRDQADSFRDTRFALGITRTGNSIGHYTVTSTTRDATLNGSPGFMVEDDTAQISGWDDPFPADPWPDTWYRTFNNDNGPNATQVSTAAFGISVAATIAALNSLGLVGAERIDGTFVLDIYYM